MKHLIAILVCALCSFGMGWAGYHLFYLSIGRSPLEIAEPNVWIARGEFLFSVAAVVLGIVSYVWILVLLRHRRCPMCGKDLKDHIDQDKPVQDREGGQHVQER